MVEGEGMKRKILTSIASAMLVSCAPIAPWHHLGQPRQAVLFGDSLAWDSAKEFVILAYPGVSVSVNTYPGTQVSDWLSYLDSVPAGVNVIMALGTNDVSIGTLDTAKYHAEAAINRLNENGNRVVWLTLNSYSAWLRSPWEIYPRVLEYNEWLRELADSGRYPNLQVWEWDHTSYAHDDWLQPDHVHHTADGQLAYAQALLEAATA
jgi:lysophospholipase L1-like esterase